MEIKAALFLNQVTSCAQIPSLNTGIGIGMGCVLTGLAKKDTAIEIEIRGKRAVAAIVPKLIYGKTAPAQIPARSSGLLSTLNPGTALHGQRSR